MEIPIHRTWYYQIDGLRCIAIVSVLIEHFAGFIGKRVGLGFFGVDLFFVISGFLITEGILKDEDKDQTQRSILKKFYLKRFLRIFPIYYLLLITSLLTYKEFNKVAIWAFTYTINYFSAFTGSEIPIPFSHLWSLSVEEQFYIFWPLCLLAIAKRYIPLFLSIIFLSSLSYFLIRQDYLGLPGRMYSLCGGGILAYVKSINLGKYSNERVVYRFYISLTIATLIFFFLDKHIGFSILSFGLVYLASNTGFQGITKKLFSDKKIIYIGKISYGIYLYHLPLAAILTYYIFDPVWLRINFSFMPVLQYHSWIIKLPLYSLLSILVAHLSYVHIEKPILALKNKI